MGRVEQSVDAAAEFVGPYIGKGDGQNRNQTERDIPNIEQLVSTALVHLQVIHDADRKQDPDAPIDGSLAGIVYALLDLVTSFGILPFLSPGVAFAQRPQSVLIIAPPSTPINNLNVLATTSCALLSIFDQGNIGIQPLLTQRALPDLVSSVAELSFSPRSSHELTSTFQVQYEKILSATQPSRLLPMLSSYLQQSVPAWLRQRLSKELALVPLRPHGARHTIEFLSLSYLSQNGRVPQEQTSSSSKLPIPLEAITQATRLLSSVPSGMSSDEWFTALAPQLFHLLDGHDGPELSRAAGQTIGGGILNRKSTGAPSTIGWKLFARPLLGSIMPDGTAHGTLRSSTLDQVVTEERDLKLALKRLSVIATSYSHSGLIKRLVGPILLSLWGLTVYAKSRSSLNAQWIELPRSIILRYFNICGDTKGTGSLTENLFWDGTSSWTFGPGSEGGVEIRSRNFKERKQFGIESLFSRVQGIGERVESFTNLLSDAKLEDDTIGAIFLQVTKRWLSSGQQNTAIKASLKYEEDTDPVAALADAKLSEALATKFQDSFARSPRHIIELMAQLLENHVNEHKSRIRAILDADKPTRANLKSILRSEEGAGGQTPVGDIDSEDLVSFALSILHTIVTSPKFSPTTAPFFSPVTPSLEYLSQAHAKLPISPHISNAANNLLKGLQPAKHESGSPEDKQGSNKALLKSALSDLTSPEPPDRAWAISTLGKLVQDPNAFPLIDVPSTAHSLLSISIADSEPYAHTAAIPVLTSLAVRSPNPTLRILIDAFVDRDERSLRLKKEQEIEQALDFRLRIGEILNNVVKADDLRTAYGQSTATRHHGLRLLVEAVLLLASRRGKRDKTLAKRLDLADAERKLQEEGEAAWGGPIPNLLEPEDQDPRDQRERDELLKILNGWEETGIEEDVRIRSSALSVLGTILEMRLGLINHNTIDAALQMVLHILIIERGAEKIILRRAALLVLMGLLRAMDSMLEDGRDDAVGLSMKESEEVERVAKWVQQEDNDELARSHAENVVEGLDTWRMNKLYRVRDIGIQLDANLGLGGNLRGLAVNPQSESAGMDRKGPVIEELK